ncbi:hypothetical protein KNE206_30540 [Kitasatospora sp. NE20-6]
MRGALRAPTPGPQKHTQEEPTMAQKVIADTAAAAASDEFDLDVRLVEAVDVASLQVLTDDGCGSTCGACTTGLH